MGGVSLMLLIDRTRECHKSYHMDKYALHEWRALALRLRDPPMGEIR